MNEKSVHIKVESYTILISIPSYDKKIIVQKTWLERKFESFKTHQFYSDIWKTTINSNAQIAYTYNN